MGKKLELAVRVTWHVEWQSAMIVTRVRDCQRVARSDVDSMLDRRKDCSAP